LTTAVHNGVSVISDESNFSILQSTSKNNLQKLLLLEETALRLKNSPKSTIKFPTSIIEEENPFKEEE
jgi:hypothetical protein